MMIFLCHKTVFGTICAALIHIPAMSDGKYSTDRLVSCRECSTRRSLYTDDT